MSAEAPKPTGIPAPDTPKEAQGCLPGFLRRFFVPQPLYGLEDFATKIQQGINNHNEAQRQQALERRNAATADMIAETARKVVAAQHQRELEQEIASTMVEARKILDEFKIEEKLKYIQKIVWKGKGKLRLIEPGTELGTDPIFGSNAMFGTSKRLGGLELVHQYPLFELNKRTVEHYEGSFDEWQYAPKTGSTSISVLVLDKGEKVLGVRSAGEIGKRKEGTYVHDPHYLTYDFSHTMDSSLGNTFDEFPGSNVLHVDIPIGLEESTALLDSALSQEVNFRITNKFLPSQLEDRARTILSGVKQRPCWMKWTGMRIGW